MHGIHASSDTGTYHAAHFLEILLPPRSSSSSSVPSQSKYVPGVFTINLYITIFLRCSPPSNAKTIPRKFAPWSISRRIGSIY